MCKENLELSKSQVWARDTLNRVLSWGVGASLLLAGFAISHGRQIGFLNPFQNPVTKDWTMEWSRLDEPAASWLWLGCLFVGSFLPSI